MIVIIKPRLCEHIRLFGRKHAKSHACFHAHRAHALHDLDNRRHIPVLRVAPRRTHAKAPRTGISGLCGLLKYSLHFHQLRRLNTAIGLHRLRAITAIFGAAAGFDAEQGT